MIKSRAIDHIVYAVPDLKEAMNQFEQLSGVRPAFGGYHTTEGTKNALVSLGNLRYLEFLAVDRNNDQAPLPRWMGVDLIHSPTITRWSLKSSNLEQDSEVLRNYNTQLGTIKSGQRKTTNGQLLAWKMSLPLAEPEVEIAPFLTDWQHSDSHPSEQLPAQCQLLNISATHPNPASLLSVLTYFYPDLDITPYDQARLSINIQTPNGIIHL